MATFLKSIFVSPLTTDLCSAGETILLRSICWETRTLAWEKVRADLKKLYLFYPSKVCKRCKEVHVGPSSHKARLCGVFKYESWRGAHYCERASVNDLSPEKVVWHRRPHDHPVVLVDEGRSYYGQAPTLVSLCSHAGAIVPLNYACKMKPQGLYFPFTNSLPNYET